MKLSIIIPCYDEENTIKPLLESLFKINFPIEREIIVIDDGSRINHKNILEEEIRTKRIKFIRISTNQGKGTAIRVGLNYAMGDIIVIQDADFEYFPSDLPKLLRVILENNSKVVYGSRFSLLPHRIPKLHLFGNYILTKVTNLLFNSDLTDMETGYKMFTKDILEKIILKAREFEFEPEITSKILLNKIKIIEIPIKYRYRRKGVAKINFLDGIEALLILIQNRFFRDSKGFKFLYRIFKYHFKKISNRILSIF